jgi:hypothetical protein
MKPSFLRSLVLTFSAACLLAGTASAAPEKPELADKLDKLLRFPGDYSQVCDATDSTFPAPIPAFHSIMHGEAYFSEKNMAFMKKNRAKLMPALAAKLESVDLLRKPKPQPNDPAIPKDEQDVEPKGVDPDSFNTLLLTIIEELDAAEVLPQLLALEGKYYPLLQAFEKDPKAPMPQADGSEGAGVSPNLLKEGEEYDKLTKEREAEIDQQREVFRAQAVHRDMLAVCVHIMRKAGFEAMLASDLEKAYGKALKAKYGADEELSKYKSAADIPKEDREYTKFDPIHKLAYRVGGDVQIPYTPEIRKQILDLTKSFINSKGAPKKKEP